MTSSRVARVRAIIVGALVALILGAPACRERDKLQNAPLDPETEETPEAIEGLTADTLLREMVFAYANAKYYLDEGYLEALYERDGDPEPLSYRENCALKFAKPNYARFEAHDAMIRIDGQKARAEILQDDYARQAIETPAPFVLTSIREFYPDAKFAEAAELCAPPNIFWTSPQLILLLAKDPLKTLAPPGAKTRLLQPAYLTYANRPGERKRLLCDRAQVVTEDGERIYWIDRATKALARCELSPEGVPAPEQGARVVSVKLEFPEQTLSQATMRDLAVFQIAPLAPSAQLVQRFIPPEIDALGRAWSRDALRQDDYGERFELPDDKKTLLCFWSVDDPNWRQTIQAFDDAAQTNPELNCVAVNLDSTTSPDVARAEANAAGLTQPLARLDRNALMRDDPEFPKIRSSAFILLDEAHNVVRYLRDAASLATLRRAVARALENDAPAAEDYNAQNVVANQFANFLTDAETQDVYRAARTPTLDRKPVPKINPKTFNLRETWRLDNLPGACNPLALDARAPAERVQEASTAPLDKLVALPCEGNAIALVNAEGELVNKMTPAAAVDEPINFLRAIAVGSQERYYAASGSMESRKIHRFNERFVDLGSLDAGKLGRLWIGDAQFAALDSRDSPILLVGAVADPSYGAGASGGLYAIDMSDLKILWKDETVLDPFCLAVTRVGTGETSRALALVAERRADMRGGIATYDVETGERVEHFKVGASDSVRRFASSSRVPEGAAQVVALVTSQGSLETSLVGYDSDGEEAWRAPAPAVEGDVALNQLVSGDLDGDGYDEWLVLSSVGTIRFYRASGQDFDAAQLGESLTGACVARWNGSSYVVTTSYNSVAAYRVEAKGARRAL